MSVDKLKSGSYRIRKYYNGKTYSTTVDHKPSKKEVVQIIADLLDELETNSTSGTFGMYLSQYISQREQDGISPSTIRGYKSIQRNIPQSFKEKSFPDMGQSQIQREVDRYAKDHSPKSTKNYYGLIRSVFAEYRPQLILSIKLPSASKKAVYEPSTKDVERILEYSQGSIYEIALQLAVLGLRRGEICALTIDDLSDDDVLTINKAVVISDDGTVSVKDSPKTADSNRRILIPHHLADAIRDKGYIYNGYPNSIRRYLHRTQEVLGIPHFPLHRLRHFAAAYLHKNGFTDQMILQYGGWAKGSDVMNRVYNYNLDPQDSQKDIADVMEKLF